MDDPKAALAFALEKYPEQVEAVPVETLLQDSARATDRRHAYLQLAVPDEVVKNLRGKQSERNLFLLVQIPREVQGRSESSIILPGEVR